jgi:hypothetical protein
MLFWSFACTRWKEKGEEWEIIRLMHFSQEKSYLKIEIFEQSLEKLYFPEKGFMQTVVVIKTRRKAKNLI